MAEPGGVEIPGIRLAESGSDGPKRTFSKWFLPLKRSGRREGAVLWGQRERVCVCTLYRVCVCMREYYPGIASTSVEQKKSAES